MMTAQRLAMGSVAVGLLVLALKAVAYHLTGSVALYSDAVESVVNVMAALAALWAVCVAVMPADDDHPFGHTKAEYFAAGLEGALIVLAAALIMHDAWGSLWVEREVDYNAVGLGANLLASVVNGAWGWVLIARGGKMRRAALVADGRHLWADVVSSVGVLAGVGLAMATGWHVLDPLLAFAVAGNVLWSGWRLIRESFGGLMDEAVEPEVLAQIREVIERKKGVALEAHDLRTRRAGAVVFVEFHLVVPGGLTVREAHGICDGIEAALEQVVAGARVTIHVEPEEKAKGWRV
ncbi:MAG: cation diffusion facilitator family transporter [Proteobacteria bacterium]|nr:cation diffusion facilitator family transporter [Pseudomonadota bacterium]